MNIYVDIDETICVHEESPGPRNYELAKPLYNNINKINRLFEDGHHVVYWTARGGTTGLDWTDLTKSQLNLWGAKHHELKMGKPNYDIFICDKVINARNFFFAEEKCLNDEAK